MFNQIQVKRNKNIEIFENTQFMCKNEPLIRESIERSKMNQTVYLEDGKLWEFNKIKKDKACELVVSTKRSLQAAQNYIKDGNKVCVLNFASATNPGGGVRKGSSAQEECLCRCSTLYNCLAIDDAFQYFYKPHRQAKNALYNDDCIYTPGVLVFKSDTDTPEVLDKKDWYSVDIITCAAPNLRENPGGSKMNPNPGEKAVTDIAREELKQIHIKRGRRILELALINKCNVVILGAFGCGAFKNPPKVVAEAYKELVKEFEYYFDAIEFAVYCPSYNDTNFRVFKNIIIEDNDTNQFIQHSIQNLVYGATGSIEDME